MAKSVSLSGSGQRNLTLLVMGETLTISGGQTIAGDGVGSDPKPAMILILNSSKPVAFSSSGAFYGLIYNQLGAFEQNSGTVRGAVLCGASYKGSGRSAISYDPAVMAGLWPTVSFVSNGGGHVEPIHVSSGQALGVLPVPNLPGSIFLGWYTDNNSFEHAVSEGTQVTSDLTLYARYAAVAEVEAADKDLFVSAMDCEAGFAIDILSSDSAMSSDAVKAALQLEVLDNTDFAGLSVSGGDGAYTVTAAEGYTPGSSYKLTLTNAALSFAGEPGSARTYCFTIHKPVVMNLRLDSGVTETPAGEISDMTINGLQASGLSVPLASVGSRF